MDADRFDALSRSLTDALSRRAALASLLGSSLGLVGLAETEAKKPCPPCKKRKNAKCKKNKPDGTTCAGGTCKSGRCVAVANPPGDPCPGQTLCDGVCIPTGQCCTRADWQAGKLCCSGDCSDTLFETGTLCLGADELCCSNYCRLSLDSSGQFVEICAATCRGNYCAEDSSCCR